jgi:hypothetical protein
VVGILRWVHCDDVEDYSALLVLDYYCHPSRRTVEIVDDFRSYYQSVMPVVVALLVVVVESCCRVALVIAVVEQESWNVSIVVFVGYTIAATRANYAGPFSLQMSLVLSLQ